MFSMGGCGFESQSGMNFFSSKGGYQCQGFGSSTFRSYLLPVVMGFNPAGVRIVFSYIGSGGVES